MTRIAIYAIAGLAFMNAACGVKSATVGNPTSPSPNAGVVTALETAAAGCDVSAALEKNPTISALLSGPCVDLMTGILDAVEANGTVAKMQSAINTFKATIAALPPGTPDLNIANAAAALAQDALNAYIQATGQTPNAAPVGTGVAPPGSAQFFASDTPRKINLTRAEKARIKAAKAKLAKKGKK